MSPPATPRIAFAHTLRGLACLVVVFFHLVLIFGTEPETVTDLTGLSLPTRPSQPLEFLAAHVPLDPGCFGVALFFLVSGLVIPLSLERLDRVGFFISRLIRLVPTYVACLGLTILGLYAAHAWLGSTYEIPWTSAATHVALVRDLACFKPIDGVVWTLEIEAKFYLLCLLIAPLLRSGDLRTILLGNAVVTALLLWLGVAPFEMAATHLGWFAVVKSFQLNAMSMLFMWMGVVLCFHHEKRCSSVMAATALVALNAMFLAQAVRNGIWGPQPFTIILSYQLALALFLVAYCAPQLFAKLPWLDRLADVSYSLYVLHGALGYATQLVLYQATGSLHLSIALGVASMIALAAVVHHVVERPTQRLGRSLAMRWMEIEEPTPVVEEIAPSTSDSDTDTPRDVIPMWESPPAPTAVRIKPSRRHAA